MSSALLFVYHAVMVAASESKSMFTYQDRVRSYRGVSREDGDLILSELGALFGRLERRLFAEQCAGRSLPMLKRSWISEHRIPARLFNSLRVSVEGKVRAVRTSMQRGAGSTRACHRPG